MISQKESLRPPFITYPRREYTRSIIAISPTYQHGAYGGFPSHILQRGILYFSLACNGKRFQAFTFLVSIWQGEFGKCQNNYYNGIELVFYKLLSVFFLLLLTKHHSRPVGARLHSWRLLGPRLQCHLHGHCTNSMHILLRQPLQCVFIIILRPQFYVLPLY